MKAAVRHDAFSGTILLARNGSPLIIKSHGMANYELNVPNTPETVFRIASLTKAFTATAAMQLQEKGKLNIADPICKHLTNCPAAWQPITIRHLLTHTSGIRNYSSLDDWDEVLGRKDYRPGEQVTLFRDLPLEFAPGEKYQYSNSGYVLLGLIIERASGKPYGRYLNDHIFIPLGMKHSRLNRTRALNPNRATGYYSRGTSFVNARYLSPTLNAAAGGVDSTVGDLLLWDQALYSDKLVSRKSLDEMFTPNRDSTASRDDYGYGWRIGEIFGRQRIHHSGSDNGYSSYIARFPADRLTVIVLSNSDKTNAGGVGTDLAAIAFGAEYKLPVARLADILWETTLQQGAAAAIRQYRDLQRTQGDRHDFSERALVRLGYHLFEAEKLADAKAIFDFSIERFPQSAYSYDGLADVADMQGNTDVAIAHFEKSLKLDPENTYAIKALAHLRPGRD